MVLSLHSIMVQLLFNKINNCIRWCYLYIPLWFNYYRCTISIHVGDIQLYIPLWFNYYRPMLPVLIPHSLLYIPLWFNYYMFLNPNIYQLIHLYIPLWFNYYAKWTGNVLRSKFFTFHYGSITIVVSQSLKNMIASLHSIMVQLLSRGWFRNTRKA